MTGQSATAARLARAIPLPVTARPMVAPVLTALVLTALVLTALAGSPSVRRMGGVAG